MFILCMINLMLNANADENNLYQKYDWENLPVIEICGKTNVTITEVNNAIKYWKEELNNPKIVKSIYRVEDCSFKNREIIRITDNFVQKHSGELANTNIKWFRYKGETIKYIDVASVNIPNGLSYKRQLTITHELGHALGYHHSNHEVMKSHF